MMLGEALLAKEIITKSQLAQALAEQAKSPSEKLGSVLVRLGFATKEQIDSVL